MYASFIGTPGPWGATGGVVSFNHGSADRTSREIGFYAVSSSILRGKNVVSASWIIASWLSKSRFCSGLLGALIVRELVGLMVYMAGIARFVVKASHFVTLKKQLQACKDDLYQSSDISFCYLSILLWSISIILCFVKLRLNHYPSLKFKRSKYKWLKK